MTLNPTDVLLVGSVMDNGEELSFSLNGALTKAEDGKEMIVGHLQDDFDNFEVIHFSLDRTGSKGMMFDRGVVKGKAGSTVLKLYLLQKNTRNLTVVELANPDFVESDGIFRQRDTLPQTDHLDQFWYPKLLKPVKQDVDSSAMNLDDFGIESFNPQAVNKDYTISYNVGGATITEHFVVQHYLSVPGSIAADGPDFFAYMKVTNQYTQSSLDGIISYNTSTKIGVSRDTTLDTFCATGDAFNYLMWDGDYVQKGSFDAMLRWDMALPGTPLGFTASYQFGQNVSSSYSYYMDNTGQLKVRLAGTKWPKGKYLQNTNNTFSALMKVGNYDPKLKSSVKTFSTRWTYDISSAQNYTWGGTQTVNVYATYGN